MRHGEQPSCLRSSIFLMGQNARGNWVVQDQRGACGGIFVDRASAVRFAMFENGNQPHAVVLVPGIFDLDLNRGANDAHRQSVGDKASPKRRAA